MSSFEAWPPPFRFRNSSRAKYLRLVIDPVVGLEVILPKGVSQAEGRRFLDEKKAWVLRHWVNVEDKANLIPETIGDQLALPAVSKTFEIARMPLKAHSKVRLMHVGKRLVLVGKVDDFSASRNALKQWLRQLAAEEYASRLHTLAQQVGVRYQRLTIREAKTRWGSCSSRGAINLNVNTLFLTPEELEYIMVHELCHLRHCNHSKRFWAFVESVLPDYRLQEKSLKNAQSRLPKWVL